MLRTGQETRPRSPSGMSPAKKLSPHQLDAGVGYRRDETVDRWPAGTATDQGYQNSTASKPTCFAADGRSNSGSSVWGLTSNRRPLFEPHRSA
jgi:hypothetical protein